MSTTFASTWTRKPAHSGCRPLAIGALALSLLGAGCLGDLDSAFTDEAPQLLAVSTDAISVGGELEFFGANFLETKESHTELVFEGKFTTSSGEVHKVRYPAKNSGAASGMRPHWADGNRLVWAQVGPFSNPFSDIDQVGTFEGKVTAINVHGLNQTISEIRSAPLPMTIKFQESIIIRGLSVVGASDCEGPAKRLLGGFPYRIEVEAAGFQPINFTYSISGERKDGRPRIFRQAAKGTVDSVGSGGELVLEPVTSDVHFYLINLTVSSLGTDGKERSNSWVFAVHRPIEYVDLKTFKVAEVLAPVPDSGCIAGGSTPRQVTYSEMTTDTRDRQVGITWNEDWSDSSTTSKTLDHSVTKGIRIDNYGSSTVEQTVGWSTSFGFNASGTIPVLGGVEAGVNGNVGRNGSYSRSYTSGWSVGRDYSTTDSESWTFAKTRGYTLSKGGQSFWTVSSSTSKQVTYTADILPGQYGVFYRQVVRVELPGEWVAYDVCGMPHRVGSGTFSDYTWSIDLGTGSTCSPLPPSKLPEATCYSQPCYGK